ncbi:ADP-ribosylation factor-like 10 isoform X2 [Amphiprion ocellaris]|uniref:ADP-ribosylation factor-like 10 n=1 Tax=Amphiprion ocellaris TaxID=80972 RepID=A0AAQ5YEW8_AMPOC|nr:ADP-ribosylation factor-like 10 isoform X2 [Amphiprion ocellaris]
MVLLRHISIALTAAVAALGSALFIALNYFYKRRIWSPQAEYCTIKEEEEERGKRQVLVLGLDGAGKSSMLQGLTPGEAKRGRCRPTRGFNFMSLDAPACQLDFLEIGGGEDLRRYWMDYLRRTHVLVYVVDSSDRSRLPLAKAELHRLLRVEPQLPVVVLGNKQELFLTVIPPFAHQHFILCASVLVLFKSHKGCFHQNLQRNEADVCRLQLTALCRQQH